MQGSCYNDIQEIKIVADGNEFHTSCENNNWHATLDLSILPEGSSTITFFGKDGTGEWIKYFERTIIKDTWKPNQIGSFLAPKITRIDSSTSLKLSNGIHIAIYASDEFCVNPKCGVTNLVLRSSSDNYKQPYFITKSTSIDSRFPNVVEKNGKLHLSYLSNERDRNIYDVIYSQIESSNFAVLSRVNLTPTLTKSAKNPFLRKTKNNQIHLVYISNEYCSTNSCSQDKITHRSDADAFTSKKFLGTHLDGCGIGDHRLYNNPANNKLHSAYRINIVAGICTGANTGYTLIDEDGSETHSRFSVGHNFSGVAFVADSQDKAAIFFATTNTYNGCSGWKLAKKTSEDNWATQVNLDNTCIYGGSYPGIDHSPSAYADENDVIHLFYGTESRSDTNGRALSYKTSTDNYLSTINLHEDYFSNVRYISAVKDDPDNFVITYQGEGFYSGGLKLTKTTPGTTTRTISPSFTPKPYIHFSNDELSVIYYSDEYCITAGCSRKNFVLEHISSGQKKFLTQEIDPKVHISNPRFVSTSSGDTFFYQSSKDYTSYQNILFKTSADNFTNPSTVTTTGTILSDVIVDDQDEIKLTYVAHRNVTQFLDNLSSLPVHINPSRESSSSIMKFNSVTNRTAIFYTGNELSAWGATLRTTADDFASFTRIQSASRREGSTLYFNPEGVLHTLSVYDPTSSGKNRLVVRSEIDNYVNSPFLFDTSEGSVCVSTPYAEYDSSGILHVTYSFKKDGERFCNIWYRNSSDWSTAHQITFSNNSDNFPSNLFIKSDGKAIICGGSSFSLDCFMP